MGSCFSCNSSSKLKNVRVVRLNGYVEDYEEAVSVRQVIGYPEKHFVCTSTQLLSSSSKSLNGDTQLQPGQVYFMLPYSVLQADVSPLDLAGLAKRLTAIAKTNPLSSHASVGVVADQCAVSIVSAKRSPCRVQPWKPILDIITENRSNESDLQESC